MCKCCQLCWEDLYWQCFEEKFCYDESIANYDPNEDEYFRANGHVLNGGETLDNNNQPITVQPSRLQRNVSTNSASKVHEEDWKREVQTANVNLPPEIVQVFAHSMIFHDHQPMKTLPPQSPGSFTIGAVKIEKNLDRSRLEQINEEDSNKLLLRLEEEDNVRDKLTPPKIIETPAFIKEEEEDEIDSEVILRPYRLKSTASKAEAAMLANVVNKRLQLDSPYFISRPASENDIFTISKLAKDRPMQSVSSTSDVNRFSMTPEVPSISFSNLPKNYLDTPTIEKFKKQEMTLTELQAREAELHLNEEFDLAMPRYYGKSDIILNSSNLSISSVASASSIAKKYVEKSKRLKALRAHIPPLSIHGKDKHEKEK